MTYFGTVKNGVVVLPPEIELAEGQVVEIAATQTAPVEKSPEEKFLETIAKPRDWPDDLAVNLDYYLHGHDRKKRPRQLRWIGNQPASELSEEIVNRDAAQLADLASETHGLPSDLAQNHDHYLHGLPKQ